MDEAEGRVRSSHEDCTPHIEQSLKSAVEKLRSETGHEIVDVNMDLSYDDLVTLFDSVTELYTLGMREDLETYMRGLTESPIWTLRDLVEWNDEHAVSVSGLR